MKSHERIIFAVDVSDRDQAVNLIERLRGYVGVFKVGLERFIADGPSFLAWMSYAAKEDGYTSPSIMLDLKLHDIPETIERAILQADYCRFGLTIHIQQREAMVRAVKAAEKTGTRLLGVSILSSMTDQDLIDLGIRGSSVEAIVRKRVALAYDCGITGFVCSPKEVSIIREAFPKTLLVVPGVRPEGSNPGDQKRIGTPKQAIQDGADYIVVGRPIRDAEDPVKAAQAIAAEIAQ